MVSEKKARPTVGKLIFSADDRIFKENGGHSKVVFLKSVKDPLPHVPLITTSLNPVLFQIIDRLHKTNVLVLKQALQY